MPMPAVSPDVKIRDILGLVSQLHDDLGGLLYAVSRYAGGGDPDGTADEWREEIIERWKEFLLSIGTSIAFELGADEKVWARFVADNRGDVVAFYDGEVESVPGGLLAEVYAEEVAHAAE